MSSQKYKFSKKQQIRFAKGPYNPTSSEQLQSGLEAILYEMIYMSYSQRLPPQNT